MSDTTNAQLTERAAPSAAIGLALLRITLGVIIVATWRGNLRDDLYTADGITGLINWLFSEEGNNSSLTGFGSFLDSVVVANAGFFATSQMVIELLFGLGLILGLFTRLSSLLAILFFISLFLAYFGGHEWIWTYVLLTMSTLAVLLGNAGRTFGIDQLLYSSRGRSPGGLLW